MVHTARQTLSPAQVIASLGVAALVVGLGALAPAHAATRTGWAQWDDLIGTAGAFETSFGPLAGGFPAAQMTSDSRDGSVGVISGASRWLSADTPVGQEYGSSRDQQYLNLRPKADNADDPSTTTYTFQTPTPSSGWTFVLGDIDADQVQVQATGLDGVPLSAAALGYQGGFNYCDPALTGAPSCTGDPADVPSWDPATQTLTGNVGALDTDGAAGWFEPNEPVTTLTLTFTRRSGLPVYQTWFAALARDISGTVTDVTPGAAGPIGGVTLTLTGPDGQELATTTTGPDGSYTFDGYTATDGYTVEMTVPEGSTPTTPTRLPADLTDTDAIDVDFEVEEAVTVSLSGQVTGPGRAPVPGAVVRATGPDGHVLETTTGPDGTYTFADLDDGAWTIAVVTPEGYIVIGPDTLTETVDGQDITDVSFALGKLGAISGEVSSGSGELVPDISIDIVGPDGSTTVTTGPDGSYALPDLPPGTYTLTILTPDGFRVDGSLTLTVTITDAGEIVTGQDFRIVRASTPAPTTPVPTPTTRPSAPASTEPTLAATGPASAAPLAVLGGLLTVAGISLFARRRRHTP